MRPQVDKSDAGEALQVREKGVSVNRLEQAYRNAAYARLNRASALVNGAIRRGELVRPDRCPLCGAAGKIEAHHWDYNAPLVVEWMCRKCHVALHVFLNSLGIRLTYEGLKWDTRQ